MQTVRDFLSTQKAAPPAGKGMAKAVCPKCKRLFGDNPLFSITTAAVEESDVEDQNDAGVMADVSGNSDDDESGTELQDDPDAGLQDDPEADDEGE